MSRWRYIETDGYPKKSGYYEVAIEQNLTFYDRTCDHEDPNRIHAFGDGPYTGICYFNGSEFEIDSEGSSLNMKDETYLCSSDHIYAWADVLVQAPKQIYPSKPVKIDPAEYHLTENQLLDFLQDYKRSYERGYTE